MKKTSPLVSMHSLLSPLMGLFFALRFSNEHTLLLSTETSGIITHTNP